MEELYGIRNTKPSKKDLVVLCTNCFKKYYEDISDERNLNALHIFFDNTQVEFYKGCPLCKTDEFLITDKS